MPPELDPRTPVLVGVAQYKQRADDLDDALDPMQMMEHVARAAAEDAGAPALLARIDSIRIPHGVWRYGNAAHRLAERLGRTGCETGVGPISGTTVQTMLSEGAQAIQAGRRDVVLLASAEVEHWKRRSRRAGRELPAWAAFGAFDPLDGSDGTPAPDLRFGGDEASPRWWERKYNARAMQAFSLYENALRHQRKAKLAEHRAAVAALWARFAQVAATNPYAWIQDSPSAEEIATPTASNRMVAYPYTKMMVANMVVDQGAALLMCALETARELGVDEGRMVFPHASAQAVQGHEISRRPDLHSHPVVRLVGERACTLAGARPDEIEHVDLYSCFPAAVQMAAAELGLSLDRPLTLTGGLTFGGGPLNSYVMHSIATAALRLREARAAGRSERALVSSIGGYIQKHAVGIYGSEPRPGGAFEHDSLDDEAQALPGRAFVESFEGDAEIETYAVMADREGAPDHLLFSCGVTGGARSWAVCRDRATLEAVDREELCGRTARVSADGEARVA